MEKLFKNPFLNSIYAEGYIILVAVGMQYVAKPDTPDNFFTPIAALSLFVLSAAIMAFLFAGEPLQLYLDGKKKQAIIFFLKTLITFALLTVVVFIFMHTKTASI